VIFVLLDPLLDGAHLGHLLLDVALGGGGGGGGGHVQARRLGGPAHQNISSPAQCGGFENYLFIVDPDLLSFSANKNVMIR